MTSIIGKSGCFPILTVLSIITVLILIPSGTGLRTGRPYGPRYQPPAGRLEPKAEIDDAETTRAQPPRLPNRELLSPRHRLQPRQRLSPSSDKLQPKSSISRNRPGVTQETTRTPLSPQSSQEDIYSSVRRPALESVPFRPRGPTRTEGSNAGPRPRDFPTAGRPAEFSDRSSETSNENSQTSSTTRGQFQSRGASIPNINYQDDAVDDSSNPSDAFARNPETLPSNRRPLTDSDRYRPPQRRPLFGEAQTPTSTQPALIYRPQPASQQYNRPTPSPTQEVIESIRSPTKVQAPESVQEKNSRRPEESDESAEKQVPPAQTSFYFKQYQSRGSQNPQNKDSRNEQNQESSTQSTRQPASSYGASREDLRPGTGIRRPSLTPNREQSQDRYNRRYNSQPSEKQIIHPEVLCSEEDQFCEKVPNYPRDLIWEKVTSNKSVISDFRHTLEEMGLIPGFGVRVGPDGRTIIVDNGGPNSDFQEQRVCDVKMDVLYPKAAKNKSGKWKFVVNDDRVLQQPVKIERCKGKNQTCARIEDNLGAGLGSRCSEKYFSSLLLTFDENDAIPKAEDFYFPVACVCYIGNYLSHQTTTAKPKSLADELNDSFSYD